MHKQTDAFLFANKQPIEQVDKGIKRQILGYNHELMMVKVWFAKDAVGTIHAHRHSQCTYVESGEFEVSIDGIVKTLKAGDAFYIEPHKDHGAVCTKEGVLIDVFSPVREDFLENK